MQSRLAYCPAWGEFWTCGAGAGLISPTTPTNGSKRPPARNSGSVPGCSYHSLSSTTYPPRNDTNYGRR